MPPRFFSDRKIDSDQIDLEGPEQHHMVHVMRLAKDDEIVLFDGSGFEFSAVIERVDRRRASLRILSKLAVDRELPMSITLGVALPKGDRQQILVEKAVELGVTQFVPLVTKRGVAQPRAKALERLHRCVIGASKQCGRNRLLTIAAPETVAEFLSRASSSRMMFAHPDPESVLLGDWLNDDSSTQDWAVAIGPEGGFDPDEVHLASQAACERVYLGNEFCESKRPHCRALRPSFIRNRSEVKCMNAVEPVAKRRFDGFSGCLSRRVSVSAAVVKLVLRLFVAIHLALVCGVVNAADDPHSVSDVVVNAYRDVHNGWSVDEVLLQDDLNLAFVEHCQRTLPDARPADLRWKLLNLRKAGKLKSIPVTRRRNDRHEGYRHLAEIAARLVQDKYTVTTDRMMCDPKCRAEFNRQSAILAAETDLYLMRKAAFGLRKARQLRPELVARVADWQREIVTYSIRDLSLRGADTLPEGPGIYIFRDNTGYLYIGESSNLRKRVAQHLNDSDRLSLGHYLRKEANADTLTVEVHSFPNTSRARLVMVRRAYESELIASRKPRFNVRP